MWRAAVLASICACAVATTPRQVGAPVVATSELDEVPALPPPPAETSATAPATGSAAVPPPDPAASGPEPTPAPVVFGLLDGEMAVEEAWERWRAGATTTYDGVFEIAVLANRGRPQAMADELMVIALVRAVELSACEPERLGRIRLLAIAVRGADHPAELDVELARLADMGPAECATPPR